MTSVATQVLTYKFRLNPERRQHRALERILEQQRQLYNAALEERIEAWLKAGKSITEIDQSRSLTVIRRDDPAFATVQRRIQRETLRRLDRAYKAFFRRAKQGAGGASGFPKFKGREYFDGFGFDAFQQVVLANGGLRFAGMPGLLKVHMDRPLPQVADPDTGELVTRIKGIWFKRVGARWYCGLQVEAPVRADRTGLGRQEIGVDWGTSVLAALSTGEEIANPRHGEALADDLRRAQRAVSRCKKGSKRRLKVRRHLQAVQRKIANRRRNTLDKVSARLVKHYAFVAVEKIDAKGLMDAERVGETLPEFVKTRRNREALETAPYMLRQMLAYKAVREGARLIVVDPKYTTQECSMCGELHFKELTAQHVCKTPGVFYGMPLPRKVNAARVILKRAWSLVDQDRGGPVPGGAEQSANGGAGLRRLGNTEGGRPPTGRRANMALPHTHAHGQRKPRPTPGRLRSSPP